MQNELNGLFSKYLIDQDIIKTDAPEPMAYVGVETIAFGCVVDDETGFNQLAEAFFKVLRDKDTAKGKYLLVRVPPTIQIEQREDKRFMKIRSRLGYFKTEDELNDAIAHKSTEEKEKSDDSVTVEIHRKPAAGE